MTGFTILTYNFRNGGKPGSENQWPTVLNIIGTVQAVPCSGAGNAPPRQAFARLGGVQRSLTRMNTKFGTGVVAAGATITPLGLPNSAAYATAVEITPPADWPSFIAAPLRVVSVHVTDKLDGGYLALAKQVLADIAARRRFGAPVLRYEDVVGDEAETPGN